MDLVEIAIEGKRYRVPRGWELLRCFQYLDFKIAYERFCWNQRCEHCATVVEPPGKRELCCRTPAVAGLAIEKLPDGVSA